MTSARGIIRKASSRSAKRIHASGDTSFMAFLTLVGVRHARSVCGAVEIVDGAGYARSLRAPGEDAIQGEVTLGRGVG